VFHFSIAIHNERRDYINEVIPHINNLILCRHSSYLPWIDMHVLAWRLKIAQKKSLIKTLCRMFEMFLKGIGSILFLKKAWKNFAEKNNKNHFRSNNYEVCTAEALCFPIFFFLTLWSSKISICLQIEIGRLSLWSNNTDLDFCHQSIIYTVSSVYFNCTLISYVHGISSV
jgi:hypothetical protein